MPENHGGVLRFRVFVSGFLEGLGALSARVKGMNAEAGRRCSGRRLLPNRAAGATLWPLAFINFMIQPEEHS